MPELSASHTSPVGKSSAMIQAGCAPRMRATSAPVAASKTDMTAPTGILL